MQSYMLKESKKIENQDGTILSLYKEISKEKLKQISTQYLETYKIDDRYGNESLHSQYKEMFSEYEWYKICKFEMYMHKYHCQDINSIT